MDGTASRTDNTVTLWCTKCTHEVASFVYKGESLCERHFTNYRDEELERLRVDAYIRKEIRAAALAAVV